MIKKILPHLIPNLGTVLAVALVLWISRAWAAPEGMPSAGLAPGVMAYQGYLTNAAGTPLNGNVNLTFRLYNVASGGTALWSEAHTGANAVPVVNGVFHTLLGSLTPIPSSVWSNPNVYLGIQAEGDAEMTPRQPLGAVPVALQAGMALTVPDAALTSRHYAPAIYRDSTASILSTTSTAPVSTNSSLMVTCETNCTLLVLQRARLAHSQANGGVLVQVLVDGAVAFADTAAPAQAYVAGDPTRWVSVSGFKFIDLAAGLHTVEVKYACQTPGTCYYYGAGDSSEMEMLSAIVFARP